MMCRFGGRATHYAYGALATTETRLASSPEKRTVTPLRSWNDSREQGRVLVAAGTRFKGKIVASSLVVAGEVYGDVEVDTLVVYPTGKLHGKAEYRRIKVHPGGILIDRTEAQAGVAQLPPAKELVSRDVPGIERTQQATDAQPDVSSEASPDTSRGRQPHFYVSF